SPASPRTEGTQNMTRESSPSVPESLPSLDQPGEPGSDRLEFFDLQRDQHPERHDDAHRALQEKFDPSLQCGAPRVRHDLADEPRRTDAEDARDDREEDHANHPFAAQV